MNKLTLSSFYNHNNFKKSVRDAERMIAKSEQELARMKPKTEFYITDCLKSLSGVNYTN